MLFCSKIQEIIMRILSRIITALPVFLCMAMCAMPVGAQEDEPDAAVHPLRLSYIGGQVSFWRDGAEDWVEARINTPLAAGDALYVGNNSELELQAGNRSFIRADDDTHLTIVNQTADFLQVKVTAGRVSFDLRALPAPGYVVEVDTPNAVFSFDRVGYYRVDVDGDVHFFTRRGGRATLIPAGGSALSILPSEEIVVRGVEVARAETYVAPEIDQWDRWNYDRSNEQIDAVSERYLSPGIAGARDLDHYGSWRVVPEYGPVWVPDALPPGWAPYSTGRWIWDPYYQWTWIDDAPWGWAPFHYGRWVYLGGYWAWTPGPVILQRPVYAPALVAFFGVGPQVSVGISIGGVGWVALSWGEPLLPWWGRSGFVGRPWWGGWSGPRVVNRVVVKPTTVINVTNITYVNTRVSNALVATSTDRFGHGQVQESARLRVQERELARIKGALPVKPNAQSLVAGGAKGVRPPEQIMTRRVVATRRPQETNLPWRTPSTKAAPRAPEPRIVPPSKPSATQLRRPEAGAQTGPERARPPLPPRYEERKLQGAPATSPRQEQREIGKTEPKPARPALPAVVPQRQRTPEPSQPRPSQERAAPEARKGELAPPKAVGERAELPGKAANRPYRGSDQGKADRRRSE